MSEARLNLLVVAHPDDEILGFGGTGAKLVAEGEIVQPVVLCGHAEARTRRPSDQELLDDMIAANRLLGFRDPVIGAFPNIKLNTVDHLEVVQFIEKQVATFLPRRLITHHPSDLNDDHKVIFRAALAAARLFQRRDNIVPLEALMLMEVQSSTDWGFGGVEVGPFIPNTFVDIADQIDAKIEALGKYRAVLRDPPHPRSREALRALATLRGAQAGLRYAEAFQTIFRTTLG